MELPNLKANMLNEKRELVRKYLEKNNFKCIPTNPEQLVEKPKTRIKRFSSSKSLPKLSKSVPKSEIVVKTLKT